jgi:hypothetical protein
LNQPKTYLTDSHEPIIRAERLCKK